MLPVYSGDTLVRVVGIDPGTTNMGVSVLEFDGLTMQITGIAPMTLNGDRLSASSWTAAMYGDRARRLEALKYALLNILHCEQPIGIASESPFYNTKRPNAFGALKEALAAAQQAVCEYDINRPLYLIDPPSVKRAVGAKGNADKDQMAAALITHPLLGEHLRRHTPYLDEHNLDASAVALSLYEAYRTGQVHSLVTTM